MKKFSTLILTACLALTAMAGCSSDNGSGGNEANAPAENGSGGGGGKAQLTALIVKNGLTKPLKEMEWLQKVEESAGVEIKWQEISSDWGQKKGALLASGDIPDLIVGQGAVGDADYAQFTGLFQDMTELIPQYAPNVEKMFEEMPVTKTISTQPDGQIYGLPKYQRFWPGSGTRQYINKQWLDELGLDAPTTWDELYAVLEAFKSKDANGNGDPNDEIPMDFAPVGTGGFGFFQPTVLLGSTGITLSDASFQGYFVEDGTVKNFVTDERYKQMVAFLHKCYAAGLINPEVFTQDYAKFQSNSRGDGTTAKVGFTFGWGASDRFGNELPAQYASLPPLKVSASSDVELSWSYDYNHMNYAGNMIAMSAKTKDKAAAMRFINELYNPVVGMQVLFGSLGPNIKDNGDGSYSVLPPQDPKMDPGTWKWTSTWGDTGPMYLADSLELDLPVDMAEVLAEEEPLREVLDKVDEKTDYYPGPFIKYSKDDLSALSLNNKNLMSVAMAKFAQWVTKGGIEAEWDAYLASCEKTGLPQNLEIMQKYYDDYQSKNN
ncbi:extracellular solute-binding protein [Paenibacillus arenilitoris]|uniref:Extracellular solute-binding protein n=1 Tax=Paenibacillus arenilitoris TaxID=2772299 RepID=A0A927CWJ7_9BACL|nr:extracellular solute-binding protein [Paenibacillus arenilitoris]MBD2872830.1 extracellular solute-binding protein [Paenibacillus arenilitoris]